MIMYARTELAQLSLIFLNDEPCWIQTLCCHNFSQRQQFFIFELMNFIFRTLRNVRKDFLEKLTSELVDPNLSTKNRSLENSSNVWIWNKAAKITVFHWLKVAVIRIIWNSGCLWGIVVDFGYRVTMILTFRFLISVFYQCSTIKHLPRNENPYLISIKYIQIYDVTNLIDSEITKDLNIS